MKRLFTISTLFAIGLCTAWTLSTLTTNAQLLLVTDRLRIVSVDQAEQRVGVARPDDDSKVRQTWVYLKPETVMVRRNYYRGGYFKDEFITYNAMYDVLRNHKGKLVKIHGGRDWDSSIDAKKIWM